MLKTVQVAFVAAAATTLAPVSVAGAAAPLKIPGALRPALPGTHSVVVQMHSAGARYEAHRRLTSRNLTLAAKVAHLRHHRAPAHRRTHIASWSIAQLRTDNARLARSIKRLTAPKPVAPAVNTTAATTTGAPTATGSTTATQSGSTAAPAGLAAIAQCESGGNPSAVGGGGAYRGLYQFDSQTWQSVGGSGDPAAASPAEQTQRAAALYARSGASSWPVCGR